MLVELWCSRLQEPKVLVPNRAWHLTALRCQDTLAKLFGRFRHLPGGKLGSGAEKPVLARCRYLPSVTSTRPSLKRGVQFSSSFSLSFTLSLLPLIPVFSTSPPHHLTTSPSRQVPVTFSGHHHPLVYLISFNQYSSFVIPQANQSFDPHLPNHHRLKHKNVAKLPNHPPPTSA